MKYAEYVLQVQCVSWFWLQYPGKLIWHTKNDGAKNIRQASRDKAMGIRAGVPDLFIAEPVHGYHGLFVELKVKPNKPTEKQERMIDWLRLRGFRVKVSYSFEEFCEAVKDYFNNFGEKKHGKETKTQSNQIG